MYWNICENIEHWPHRKLLKIEYLHKGVILRASFDLLKREKKTITFTFVLAWLYSCESVSEQYHMIIPHAEHHFVTLHIHLSTTFYSSIQSVSRFTELYIRTNCLIRHSTKINSLTYYLKLNILHCNEDFEHVHCTIAPRTPLRQNQPRHTKRTRSVFKYNISKASEHMPCAILHVTKKHVYIKLNKLISQSVIMNCMASPKRVTHEEKAFYKSQYVDGLCIAWDSEHLCHTCRVVWVRGAVNVLQSKLITIFV